METVVKLDSYPHMRVARDLPMRDGNSDPPPSSRVFRTARDLPMRDGNTYIASEYLVFAHRPRSSYEGWKH